jgi:hypothetical protein
MMLVFMGGTPVVNIEISGFSYRTPVCAHQISPLTHIGRDPIKSPVR